MSLDNVHNSKLTSDLEVDWARKDSNLRRHKPSDLQSNFRTATSLGDAGDSEGAKRYHLNVSQQAGEVLA